MFSFKEQEPIRETIGKVSAQRLLGKTIEAAVDPT